ncbi:MAG: gliding motility-associated C-terminal domain-containing protein, partial [Bacteroidales bacterium]|nr:gliding motility-associated C-terminal domain-containing protein [Bacteroidales bacterium]
LNPPIDRVDQYRLVIYNPGAYDTDGDSLAYFLTPCTGENGEPIEGYTTPPATSTISVNPTTGDFIWDTPPVIGKYNIAMRIDEWRDGVKIGSLTRDMQIEVLDTDNTPPEIEEVPNFCIVSGDSISVTTRTTDQDGDRISLTAAGGPFLFQTSPAMMEEISSIPGENISRFTWKTSCEHIRGESYRIILTARDDYLNENLVAYKAFDIKVIGPEPTGLEAKAGNGFMQLSWNSPNCSPNKYLIYRKQNPGNYVIDSCIAGLNENFGYNLIGETEDTVFVDLDNGEGLLQGFDYCYRVVAKYAKGQSYASNEACERLAPGIPILTNVNVLNTDETNGEIRVRWVKPTGLDTILNATGPYRYLIYRSNDAQALNLHKIDSISSLEDTSYLSSALNTRNEQYSYRVALFNVAPGNRFRIGIPGIASSVFLTTEPADNMVKISISKNTPWYDNNYVVYRQNKETLEFDSIGYTNEKVYRDENLANGSSYCYKVKSVGTYEVNSNEYETINWSNEVCETPADYQRPCPVKLKVVSYCDSLKNVLTWNNPNLSCADDVVAYNIYYSKHTGQALDSIHRIEGAENTTYEHFPTEGLGACYSVAAVDSFNNVSDLAFVQCVDNCSYYELPNVFSPNGDNINDVYRAINPSNYVQKVNMKIFNRWGELIFKTENPNIEWDGKIMNTNRIASTGVYYYICDVWEPRVTGLTLRNIVGFIHLYSQKTGGE